MTTYPILCSGPGPHDPTDGVLGQSTVENSGGMLCALCAAAADAVPDAPMSTLVTVQVDPLAVASALAAAQKATTVAGLRSAVVALGQQLQS